MGQMSRWTRGQKGTSLDLMLFVDTKDLRQVETLPRSLGKREWSRTEGRVASVALITCGRRP